MKSAWLTASLPSRRPPPPAGGRRLSSAPGGGDRLPHRRLRARQPELGEERQREDHGNERDDRDPLAEAQLKARHVLAGAVVHRADEPAQRVEGRSDDAEEGEDRNYQL